ncbi:MAG: hypothetical protein ABI557_14645, partial [Aureliella sp.]
GHEIKKFGAGVAEPFPPTVETRKEHAYTRNDFTPEDRRERKGENENKGMYDDVLEALRGVESLLVIGPGEAKIEFSKHLKAKKVRGVSVELETADKMTEPQLAAKIKNFFSTVPAVKADDAR